MVLIDRVPTGIHGLDEVIQGGFPKGDTILLTGTPGTGKTTFALQYLVEGAVRHGERGVYITLEKSIDRLEARVHPFGWDLKRLEKEKKIMILDPVIKTEFGEDPVEWLQSKEVQKKINAFAPQRVALDSLTQLLQYTREKGGIRRGIKTIMDSYQLDATALFIHERQYGGIDNVEYTPEEYIADGIVYMQLIREADEYHRGLTVLKMRGTSHTLRILPYIIEKDGIRVKPSSPLRITKSGIKIRF
ncbi:Circadian clock protein kinase KaiC [uncultured archaeon]|nr:Circadian clock protein kinase KaiC [uncultured archaeon]